MPGRSSLLDTCDLVYVRRPEKVRWVSRQMNMAIDFKEESCRSGNFSLSGTIGIDRVIF
jgi:hypothetical protein